MRQISEVINYAIMPVVFSVFPSVDYHATTFSLSYAFATLLRIGMFIVPLLVMMVTDGFWVKLDTYREQARVRYTHDCIIVAEGTGADGPQTDLFTWSTFPVYNTLTEKNLVVPIIRTIEKDIDDDGIYDELELKVELPVQGSTSINHFRVIMFFDYQLSSRVNIRMQSLAVADMTSPLSGGSMWIDADLGLHQRVPFNHTGTNNIYNTPIIPLETTPVSIQPYKQDEFMSSYLDRQFYTQLTNVHSVWKSGRGVDERFTATVKVRYNAQTFEYIPGIVYVLKIMFVQYSVFYFIIGMIGNFLLRFIFVNQVLTASPYSPFNELLKNK